LTYHKKNLTSIVRYMLAKRIIPTILCDERKLVKGKGFNAWRSVGVTAQAARIHAMRGVDELIILDITATNQGRRPDFALIRELTETIFCPITVGGGVKSVDDVNELLRAGADKVAICSGCYEVAGLLSEATKRFGSQAIVGVVEANRTDDVENAWASVRSGKVDLKMPALAWAGWLEAMGAGEILLTSVERDGTMQGYDLDLIREVSNAVDIPVIASGGCKDYEDMLNAINAGASGVASGAMFLFDDKTPRGAAEYLSQNGIEVRI